MQAIVSLSKDSGKYYYYFCPTGKKGGCTAPLVKESDLTESVWLMLKAYIENIVSLERLLSNIDAEQLTSELAKNCKAKIATSEAKLEQIEQFKMSLYENLVEEIISKDEHRLYKKKYDEESKQIETVLDGLRRELDDITGNRAERMMWIEHFKRHKNLPGINRKAVIQLIRTITVRGKDELDIQFYYKSEFEKACEFLMSYKEAV